MGASGIAALMAVSLYQAAARPEPSGCSVKVHSPELATSSTA